VNCVYLGAAAVPMQRAYTLPAGQWQFIYHVNDLLLSNADPGFGGYFHGPILAHSPDGSATSTQSGFGLCFVSKTGFSTVAIVADPLCTSAGNGQDNGLAANGGMVVTVAPEGTLGVNQFTPLYAGDTLPATVLRRPFAFSPTVNAGGTISFAAATDGTSRIMFAGYSNNGTVFFNAPGSAATVGSNALAFGGYEANLPDFTHHLNYFPYVGGVGGSTIGVVVWTLDPVTLLPTVLTNSGAVLCQGGPLDGKSPNAEIATPWGYWVDNNSGTSAQGPGFVTLPDYSGYFAVNLTAADGTVFFNRLVQVGADGTVYHVEFDAATNISTVWTSLAPLAVPTPPPTPAAAATGSTGYVQCEWEALGRGFVVAGFNLFEVFANRTFVLRGTCAPGPVVVMCDNGIQLVVSTGACGYTLTLATNVFAPILATGANSAGWLGATHLCEIDGYVVALEANSQVFTISGENDATAWDPLDFGDSEGAPENVVGMESLQRQLWLLSDDHGDVYYDSGAALFPFARLEGAFFTQGISPGGKTLCKADNTLMWLGQNKDGVGIVWRATGYAPKRASNYVVEAAIASCLETDPVNGLAGASAYCYQELGHTYYRLDLPSAWGGAGDCRVLDIGENSWHQRKYWDAAHARWLPDLARCHMFAFGQHLVGDYTSPNLYVQSMDLDTHNGALIRRIRRCPVPSKGDDFAQLNELRLILDTKRMPLPAPGVAPPTITMRLSKDGVTWGSDRTLPLAPFGVYGAKVAWRRMGRARRGLIEVEFTNPFFGCFVNAFLDWE
jgi:hypothetical protein